LAFIHRTIFEYLYRCSYTQDSGSDRLCSGNDRNLAVLHEIYGKVRENYHWSSKEMLQHIRERQLFKRQQLQQKSLTALEFESMSPPGAGDTEHFLRLATTDEEEEAADEHERILMCLDNLNWGSLGS
jgi:hypothetical protein